MNYRMIILNGGSSSGKSSLARALQNTLHDPWLTFGVDDLIEGVPPRLLTGEAGLAFGEDGSVSPGADFTALNRAWDAGLVAMARAGARVIVDEVFLRGGESQREWLKLLAGLPVLWVGVHCAPEVAEQREAGRGDRTPGMAAMQATAVHKGMTYDVVVDTSTTSVEEAAKAVADALT
ncbi:AAA family ATPase [Phytomonospora sp. NPDC050363]|uniref:chloramphenicol phosphotransferase CPT family protein n=1 Tax=Phytomonospora sp. NPDC050363 TaxID=3155642 RepID=UPI0033DA480A